MSSPVIERLFSEVLAGPRDLAVLDRLLSPDYFDHSPAGNNTGRTGVRAKLEALRVGFPDIVFTLEASVAEGDIAAARWHWEGTHTGEFIGFAPSGRRVFVRGMDFYRIADGQIAEHWDVVDQAGLLVQLQGAGDASRAD